MDDKSHKKKEKVASLTKVIIISILLFVIDAYFLNQGVISIFFAIILVIRLPFAIFKKANRLKKLRNIAIYAFAIVLVITFNVQNNRIAQKRAEIVLSAIKTFYKQEHRYPKNLDELVPKYIEKIPPAKYTASFSKFRYYSVPTISNPMFCYTVMPPFAMQCYDFDKNKWIFAD